MMNRAWHRHVVILVLALSSLAGCTKKDVELTPAVEPYDAALPFTALGRGSALRFTRDFEIPAKIAGYRVLGEGLSEQMANGDGDKQLVVRAGMWVFMTQKKDASWSIPKGTELVVKKTTRSVNTRGQWLSYSLAFEANSFVKHLSITTTGSASEIDVFGQDDDFGSLGDVSRYTFGALEVARVRQATPRGLDVMKPGTNIVFLKDYKMRAHRAGLLTFADEMPYETTGNGKRRTVHVRSSMWIKTERPEAWAIKAGTVLTVDEVWRTVNTRGEWLEYDVRIEGHPIVRNVSITASSVTPEEKVFAPDDDYATPDDLPRLTKGYLAVTEAQ